MVFSWLKRLSGGSRLEAFDADALRGAEADNKRPNTAYRPSVGLSPRAAERSRGEPHRFTTTIPPEDLARMLAAMPSKGLEMGAKRYVAHHARGPNQFVLSTYVQAHKRQDNVYVFDGHVERAPGGSRVDGVVRLSLGYLGFAGVLLTAGCGMLLYALIQLIVRMSDGATLERAVSRFDVGMLPALFVCFFVPFVLVRVGATERRRQLVEAVTVFFARLSRHYDAQRGKSER